MKLKMCVMAALLCGSGAGFADTSIGIGWLASPGSTSQTFGNAFWRSWTSQSQLGGFQDSYTFDIVTPFPVTVSGGFTVESAGYLSLSLGGVWLSGDSLGSGNFLFASSTSAFSFSGLGAGTYTLNVSGLALPARIGNGAAAYNGTLSASVSAPVPEVETYAMLFVGLTAAGVMAARRARRIEA